MVVEQQALRNNENCRCCSQASTKAATPLDSSVQPVAIQKARLAEQSREMGSVEAWRDSHLLQKQSGGQQKQLGQHQLRHKAKKEPAAAAAGDTLAAQEDMPAVAVVVAAAAAEIRLPMDTPRQILAQVVPQAALRTAPAWP